MGITATPTQETLITALHTLINAISSIGTVYTGFHRYKDDLEHILRNNLVASGSFDLWFISSRGEKPFAGKARGENYVRFMLEVRHWCLRTNDSDWDKTCRQKDTQVKDAIAEASTIWQSGGVRQVWTETEQAEEESHGEEFLRAAEGVPPQKVFFTRLLVPIESRRFS